jgi:D-alanine-D-alanine ligase
MSEPRVLIIFNQPTLPSDHPEADSERDVLYSVQVVQGFLHDAGISSTDLAVGPDLTSFIRHVQSHRPDVVFNLFEGFADRSQTESTVTGLLEWLELPFTGCPTQAIVIARNKALAKHLMLGAGLNTPDFFLVDHRPCPKNQLGWPVIVKPCWEDASVGIDQGAVVTNDRQLADRVELIRSRYGTPVIVEQFISGREIHVMLVELHEHAEPTVLPFSEILFEKGDDHLWPIYSYDAKWRTDSAEYERTPVDVPVQLQDDLSQIVIASAKRVYQLFGCRDYARVDARISADGEVFLLEVNPNPSLTSIMLRYGLEAINWTHGHYIAHLVRRAARRGALSRQKPPLTIESPAVE